jgi:nucleoside-diphosphate-sugar epimerase
LLASGGVAVRVLARAGGDLRHLADCPVEIVRGSLTDTESLAAAVRGVTHIYHCAACSTDWAPWRVYYEANVIGVRNLLAAAIAAGGVRRFLHVSTTDVYGYPRHPCDESGPLTDVGLPYNRTKCQGEELVREASAAGLAVTIIRPATIWGPRGKAFAADIAQLIRQGLMAVLDGGRSPGGFCYVDNAAEALIAAAHAQETLGRAYNIADGTGVTWRTYVDALADGLGRRRPWIDIPSAVAFPLAFAMEAARRCLPGRPLLTRHAVRLLSRNQEFPIESARRDFGFRPEVSFEEGMARTIAWLKGKSGYA